MNDEVEHSEAEVEVDVVGNTVVEVTQQRLDVTEMQELQTACQIAGFCPINHAEDVSSQIR